HEKCRDELLNRSLLRHRPDVHATLNELSIVHEEIDAQRLRRYRERDHEAPCLPVVERTRRKKEAGEQNCKRYQIRQHPADEKISQHASLNLHHTQPPSRLTPFRCRKNVIYLIKDYGPASIPCHQQSPYRSTIVFAKRSSAGT